MNFHQILTILWAMIYARYISSFTKILYLLQNDMAIHSYEYVYSTVHVDTTYSPDIATMYVGLYILHSCM